ncbi:hypothetical protein [Rathayibacter rathayi]|uniref:hypothetical protein n=1 Tax=Rathayibacter rathayi TaxID=33887 RepID=UPI0011AFF9E0
MADDHQSAPPGSQNLDEVIGRGQVPVVRRLAEHEQLRSRLRQHETGERHEEALAARERSRRSIDRLTSHEQSRERIPQLDHRQIRRGGARTRAGCSSNS